MPTTMEPLDLDDLPPVPFEGQRVTTADYGAVAVDTSDERFTEDLVYLDDYGIAGVSYYDISDGSNPPYGQKLAGSLPRLLSRRSVAERLQTVNVRLKPSNLEVFVWDAFRPVSTQSGIWDFFEQQVRASNPSYSDAAVYDEVRKYVSDPNKFREDDPSTWPTHMTGASVDLTIRNAQSHELLDMGAHFDQMDETAHTDYFENQRAEGSIEDRDPRLLNRRLLYFVMTEAGFTNYPLEYWHFDWGNQMYQMVRSARSGRAIEPAFYGLPPTV